MSMRDKSVKIVCGNSGRTLCIDAYDSDEVDRVLDANRCACGDDDRESCKVCDGTGYCGEFSIEWIDTDNDELNVYEYVNY